MRIAYVLVWPEGASSGVFKKAVAQARAWQTSGATVGIFVLTAEGEGLRDWSAETNTIWAQPRGTGARTLRQRRDLIHAALRWRPDVVYHRYVMPDPAMIAACRRVPVVVEVNTNDLIEYPIVVPRRAAANRRLRGWLLARAAGLVFVSTELRDAPAFARFARPSVVIGNGIDLDDVAVLEAAPGPRPRLVFIGSAGCPWHGLDQITALALLRTDWDFDVIGIDAADAPLPAPNVTYHGALRPAAYRPLLERADVGLGSLAMWRSGLSEASPLKVREYLACGLPTVIGYADTDFLDGAEFIYRVDNADGALVREADDVAAFLLSWRGRRVDRAAVQHLDSRVKEHRRLEFMQTVARGHSGRLDQATAPPHTGSW